MRTWTACAATLFLWIAACAPNHEPAPAPAAPAPARTSDAAEGQRLAEIYCARCHAIGTEGESTHPMAPPFRTLSQSYPVNALEEAFAEGILVGHPDMPEFRLEPQQIDNLLAYLDSIQVQRGG